jgi:uncharacterized protein YndB with AHSA1/START domain
MKWVLIALGALVGLGVLVLVVGLLRPKSHTASRTFRLAKAPADVWAVISDFERVPEWFGEVTKVERIADVDGRPAYRETFGGNFTVTTVMRELVPPQRIVREILPGGAFHGTWTWLLAAEGPGSRLTITERGTVPNPFFRGMMVFHSNTRTMELYAEALGRRLGTSVEAGN